MGGGRDREKERPREGHEVITRTLDCVSFRAPSFLCLSLALALSLLVEVLALARFCIRRKSVDSLEREH